MAKSKAQVQFEADTSGFTQGIKEADQSLVTLRKELNLNSAELKENADDVDLLAKRKEILQNELDQTQKKLDGLKNKLEAAKTSFGENSREVYQLQNKILDTQTAFQKIQNEITQTDSKLNNLESGLSETKQEMKNVDNATDDLSESFGATEVAVGSLVANGIQELSGALKDLAVDSDTAMSNFQAQTGLSTEAMSEFEGVIEETYSKNFGESINDIANAMAQVKQQTKETDPTNLQKMTENALTLRDTFDFDIAESMRAVNSLMNQFGIDSDTAFNLVVQGAQNGLNANGDMLDVINEYSVQFKNAGYSADDMFNMLQNGTKAGTWSVDKLGDAVKEMNIRFSDGTVAEALEDNKKALGLTSKEVSNLTKEFNKGGDHSKKAIQKMINSIMSVEDETERYKLGVSVFGTMWEDLGAEAIESLMSTKGEIDSTKQSMEELTQVKYDNITSQMQEIGRMIQTDFLIPLAEGLLPVLKDAFSWISDNLDWLVPVITGLGIALGTYFAVSKFMNFISVVKNLITMVKTGTTVMGALNTVMALNPIALVVAAIVGLIAIFVVLWNKCDGFREFWINLWEKIKSIASSVWEALKTGFKNLGDTLSNIWSSIKSTVSTVWDNIKTVISNVWNTIKTSVSNAINNVKSVITNVFNTVKSTTSNVWNGIKSTISNVVGGVKSKVSSVFNGIKSTISNIWDSVKSKTSSVWNSIKSAISNPIESAKETVRKAINKIKGFLDFDFKLPKPKIPSFSVSGGEAPWGFMGKGKLPSISIKWNKDGVIFTKPTIMNTNQGFQGVGEAGAEAVLPIEKLENWINRGFNNIVNNNYYSNEKIDRLIEVAEEILEKPFNSYLNGRKVSEEIAEPSDKVNSTRYNLKNRGLVL